MKLNPKYLIAGITIAVTGAIGIVSHFLGAKDDSEIEEVAEAIIEGQIEGALGLPSGSRRGSIDLSPRSRE